MLRISVLQGRCSKHLLFLKCMPSFFFKFSSPKAHIKCLAHVKKIKNKIQNHDVSIACQQATHLNTTVFTRVFQSVCSLYYRVKIVLQNYLQTYSSVSIPQETLKRLQALSMAAQCYKRMSLAIHRVPGPMWLPELMDAQVPQQQGGVCVHTACASLSVSLKSSLGHLKYLIRLWRCLTQVVHETQGSGPQNCIKPDMALHACKSL